MFRPLVVVLIGVGIAAMACVQPASPGAVQTSTNEPRYGGQLNLRLSGDFVSFDTTLGAGRDPNIAELGRNSLLGYKVGPGIKYEEAILQPELAEKWEVSSDARSYTLTLRKGVKFHNLPPVNGREMTSADIKAAFEYWSRTGPYKDRKLPPSRIVAPVDGLDKIETPDKYTVVLRYKEAFAPFLSTVATPPSSIFPQEMLEGSPPPQDRTIATGPFWLDLSAGQKGTRYVWKKNSDYWDAGKPYLDEVRQLYIQDSGTAAAAFQTQQIDMFTEDIGIREGEEIAKANPNAVRFENPNPRMGTLVFNERSGYLFNDVRLRKAFSLALDRDEFIKTFSNGKGQWALTNSQPGMFTPEETKQLLRYDPAEAARLVKEAGYADGVNVDTIFSNQDGEALATRLQLAQAQMKKVGINLTLKPLENTDFVAKRKNGEHQLFIFQSGNITPDLDSTLITLTSIKDPTNYSGTNDAGFNALALAQRKEVDANKRKDIVKQAIRYINEHYLVGQFLFLGVGVQFWHPYVKGNYPNGAADDGRSYMPRTQYVWLEK